ncbi:MAG: glycine cleavage system aminomethyltransferase GcvT [Myxococcota bacterium]
MSELKKTPFHGFQAASGARMVPFAGYEMAVQFAGVMAEHGAVREAVGLFDVSHMGEVVFEGPGALGAVQHLITNDASRLSEGRALYTVMCNGEGGVIDDLIVYRDSGEKFFCVINASRRVADLAHMRAVVDDFDCSLTDESDHWGLLALQGPRAAEHLSEFTDLPLTEMKAFDHRIGEVAGVAGVRVARTGYTGEDGFEIYVRAASGEALWKTLVDDRVTLCGLGARDTLRLEMKFPLYGNDLDLEHNPLEAGLGWTVKLNKEAFIGKEALAAVKADGPARKWVGFRMEGRGIPRQGYPIKTTSGDGVVTSGTHSPSLGAPIGVGYVPASDASIGTEIEIEIRGKSVPARIVKTPFLER